MPFEVAPASKFRVDGDKTLLKQTIDFDQPIHLSKQPKAANDIFFALFYFISIRL